MEQLELSLEQWRLTLKHCRLTLEPWRLTIKPWLANPGAPEVKLRGVDSHPGIVKAHL